MLFIELNIGKGITERVLMYENEDPQGVIETIAAKHSILQIEYKKYIDLNEAAKEKLAGIIINQLQSIKEVENE